MKIEIVIPQLGEAVAEVRLAEWLKNEGDQIRKGEPLFEVDTDKAVVEVEAFADGTLVEILVPAGSPVMPQQVVALLEPAEETAWPYGVPGRPDEAPYAAEVTPDRKAPPVVGPARVQASPKARRLAEELGVDLAGLVGTGVDGMITVRDVQEAARAIPAASPIPEGAQPLSRLREAIARRMALSKTTIPHFYVIRDVNMTQAARLRDRASEQDDEKLSYTTLFLRACALALRDFPTLNANLRDGRLFPRATIDIGVAVAVAPIDDTSSGGGEGEAGLIAPVIREVDKKPLREINLELSELVARARSNRLRSYDLEPAGRSLIITNLGMYKVDTFIPIIDPPDPMILAVGAVADRPWVEDGRLVVRLAATLTLAADHRIMDGVTGARFLDRVCDLLENPDAL